MSMTPNLNPAVEAALAQLGNGITLTSTPFDKITPGSTIDVSHRNNMVEPFEATVLEYVESFGAQSVPALIVEPTGLGEAQIITADGYWEARVTRDGSALRFDEDPASVSLFASRPRKMKGITFSGGTPSATEIIRWTSGVLHVSWQAETTNDPEHLVIGGTERMSIGDTLLIDENGSHLLLDPNQLARQFDIVEA